MSNVIGVIPARWQATRFPGKMLAEISGKPLIQRVWEQAAKSGALSRLLVATDDDRIAEAVRSFGGEAVMTQPDHPSGTDRVAEAVQGIDAAALINIQGDEPLIEPALIDELARAICGPGEWDMVTAAEPLADAALIAQPSVVKVVCDETGRALYFSRAPIPYSRDERRAGSGAPLHYRHVGIYGYRRDFLRRLVAAPPSLLEQAEKLEQLRALHIGGRIKVIVTSHHAVGVDEPADIQRVEAALRHAGKE